MRLAPVSKHDVQSMANYAHVVTDAVDGETGGAATTKTDEKSTAPALSDRRRRDSLVTGPLKANSVNVISAGD